MAARELRPVRANHLGEGGIETQGATPASSRPAGDLRDWLRGENAWVQPLLHRSGRRTVEAARRNSPSNGLAFRALSQALRELLMLQDGRWPLEMLEEPLADHAIDGVLEYAGAISALLDGVESGSIDRDFLEERERTNTLFPILDPENFMVPPTTK